MTDRTLQGKSGLLSETWIIVILLALASTASHGSQSGSPNLKPFQPDGWAEAIVVSSRQGDNIDTRELNPSDLLYIDFAVINSGSSATAAPFRIELFVDGRLRESFDVSPPLHPQVYRFSEDYPIGRLDIGTHTIRVVADAGDAVSESDESDNEYTKTIVVGGNCVPLLHRVSPPGAGGLTLSREPNCSGTTVSSLPVLGHYPAKELGIGGEPILRARRARAFAALQAKARLEDRVRVIVGLRTGGPSAATDFRGFSETGLRSSRIAQVQQSLMNRMHAHNASLIRRFKFVPYLAMELDAAALAALSSDPEVVSIEEDLVVNSLLGESTLLIGAPATWSQGFSGSGQVIAILDTGVDKNHPFLAGRVVSEACYSGFSGWRSFCPGQLQESTEPGSGMPCPPTNRDCRHGTAVAGVAAGRGTDFSGVAPDAGIIAIQVFEGCGRDCITSNHSNVIAGLERVLELSSSHSIAAVNMSLGSEVDSRNCDADFPALKAAVDNLRAVGIATVAASGNDSSAEWINAPACLSGAVSVGSTNHSVDGASKEEVSYFSNSSSSLDMLAPGRWITTSVPGGGFDQFSGTSLAAPHVAGAWAVLKSKASDASPPQLLFMMTRTGVPIADPRNGLISPRIQVDAAAKVVVPPLSYSSGTLLTLTATPNPGYRFALWRGCDSSSGNRCVVEVDSVKNISAVFEPLVAPDLLVTSLMTPPKATVGSPVSIASVIVNQGSVDAGPFRVGFYLSEDPTITAEDIWFAACSYNKGLPQGGSESCSRSFPVPPWVSPGTYFLGAIVDDLDRVAENSETNNARTSDSGPVEVLPPTPTTTSRYFIPVILSAAGRNDSFFTSELTLTNRGNEEARLDYTYTAHVGGGSGTASDTLAPGQQKIETDALRYLRKLGLAVPDSGHRIGTLAVDSPASSGLGVLIRTTTAVPEGRAGLAYPGVPADAGFHEPVYLCGLRQNERDRSNLAVQHMGAPEDGPVRLAARVYSGDEADREPRILEDVTLGPGEFYQFSRVLGSVSNGYVRVERVEGTAPFYTYGVINDQTNSDGSFIFPVPLSAGTGRMGQTLPVIVETGKFSSELTVTNFSDEAKTLRLRFVSNGVRTPDRTATFTLALEGGEQQLIPELIDYMRRHGVTGVPLARGGLAGSLFVTEENGDMSGVVIGARTGSPDGDGGHYGVFYNAVPDGSAFIDIALVDALQQNEENRSNLALVNTGEVDASASVFSLDIYDGDTGRLVRTLTTKPLPAQGWRQYNSILADHARGTRHGYIRIRKISGNNPFLAYGVVNDGGSSGERSGDGAYVPARK